jgi:hypothetical protein
LRGRHAEIKRNSTVQGKDSLMSQKNKGNETLELHANPSKPLRLNSSANHAPSYEELRRRAYEIYLERDGLGGNEVDDWLQAEAELRGNGFAMQATEETKRGA